MPRLLFYFAGWRRTRLLAAFFSVSGLWYSCGTLFTGTFALPRALGVAGREQARQRYL